MRWAHNSHVPGFNLAQINFFIFFLNLDKNFLKSIFYANRDEPICKITEFHLTTLELLIVRNLIPAGACSIPK